MNHIKTHFAACEDSSFAEPMVLNKLHQQQNCPILLSRKITFVCKVVLLFIETYMNLLI